MRDRHAGHAQSASAHRFGAPVHAPPHSHACMPRSHLRATPCMPSRLPHVSGMACFSALLRAIFCCTGRHRRRFRSAEAWPSACAVADGRTMARTATFTIRHHLNIWRKALRLCYSMPPCASSHILRFCRRHCGRPSGRSERWPTLAHRTLVSCAHSRLRDLTGHVYCVPREVLSCSIYIIMSILTSQAISMNF